MKDLKKVGQLYNSSFPVTEKAPFRYLVEPFDTVDFLAFYDGELFVGFVYLIFHSDISYIFYLAVDDSLRGKGYGTAILQYIRRHHPADRIILEIEDASVSTDNAEICMRRKNFYLQNGYVDQRIHIKMHGVPMEILSQGGSIMRSEYLQLWKELMQLFSGKDNVDVFLREMFE
jgi:GNAT superfamily N-acetyltransferase